MQPSAHSFAAIDPLSVILPTSVYLALVEKLHPNVPPEVALAEVVRTMTPDEKRLAVSNSQRIAAYAQAVQKAVG